MIDAKNTFIQHTIVGAFTILVIFIFVTVFDLPLEKALGRTSFILLFLILIIGPIMKLKKPNRVFTPLAIPWSWRGELGIWFAITALGHFIIIWSENSLADLIKIGGGGYGLANFIGLIALLLSLILAATSFGKVIVALGVESWKWLHSFVYVVFYLVSAHFMYFQFFSSYGQVGPDWFGYMAAAMAAIVIILQIAAFITVSLKNKKGSATN